ncbi:hypothetical protein FRC17_004033, partial [Serendipita sp. 399]
MKHLSQIKNKIMHSSSSSFPKTPDQKALERQRGEMDSFMLSFSTHEMIMESLQKGLFEVYKARNLSGMLIREFRVEEFAQLKDGWTGTFQERITLLEAEMETIIDGTDRDRVCTRVVELVSAALVAASYGGTYDEDAYDGWKS